MARGKVFLARVVLLLVFNKFHSVGFNARSYKGLVPPSQTGFGPLLCAAMIWLASQTSCHLAKR